MRLMEPRELFLITPMARLDSTLKSKELVTPLMTSLTTLLTKAWMDTKLRLTNPTRSLFTINLLQRCNSVNSSKTECDSSYNCF